MPRLHSRKPRDWLTARCRPHFGNPLYAHDMKWLSAGTDEARVRLSAAQAQHQIARTVESLLRTEMYEAYEKNWRLVAEEMTTMSYGALRAVLRGETHMTLLHVRELEATFSPILLLSEQAAEANGMTGEAVKGYELPGA
jgi:hypothetical protein